MKKSRNMVDIGVPIFFIFFLLVLWELIVRWESTPEWILPGPIQILKTFGETLPMMLEHTRSTMLECLLGFAVAIILAVIIAVVMDELPLVKKALYPLLITSQTIPTVSVAPLFIIWFGYGILPKVLVVILMCFFPVAISLLGGLAAVDRDYLELFRSMGASKIAIFRMVKLPLSLPAFFSGLKISATYSVMGAVIGEWLGAKEGIGYYLTLSQRSYMVDRVFAAILVITILSLLIFALIVAVERLVIPWHRLNKQDN
ncbi:MAG TPA: ABC transporter permease [Peptococcaceae bacterium]|nr:ABC transporter permease [Peptococcaceae bacterium]HBI27325.1 ABC transporter permease [Peptococcaceae bacterium]